MSKPSLGQRAATLMKISCVFYAFTEHVGCLTLGLGPSMSPALETGDIMVCDRVTPRYRPHILSRGDVVSALDPCTSRRILVKRIVGLAGDEFETRNSGSKTVVPPGHVWLQGDNVDASRDSRDFGPVPMAMILGRNMYVLMPLGRRGPIPPGEKDSRTSASDKHQES